MAFCLHRTLHFSPIYKTKLRDSIFIANKLKMVSNNTTIGPTLSALFFIFNLGHLKTYFFTFSGYCDKHHPFVSAFVTTEYFIDDCITAMYKNCGLEQCFMLCCKHRCRSFGHSPSQLCVVNSCTVPEKSKKRKILFGNSFQYFL